MSAKNNHQLPRFAVVGHPNKGKSSIVSTLAQDDRVSISDTPGTTTRSTTYPMQIDGKRLYELIDTPGFQKAQQVLAWLKAHETDIHQRPTLIKEFIKAHKDDGEFIDECELLAPIMEGAGILYVVDGSRPYGREYESEMEILRWTGQPSMALINMISDDNYSEQWQQALSQFFKIVRIFNPLTAQWDKRVALLKAFGALKQEWAIPLDQAVAHLEKNHHDKAKQSAKVIAQCLMQMLQLKLSSRIFNELNIESIKQKQYDQFLDEIIDIENKSRQQIKQIYQYHHLNITDGKIETLDLELFSEKSWSIFGLSQKELNMTAMGGGAAMGATVDLALGGASLFLGAGLGAVIGWLTAVFSKNMLAETKVLGLPLGGHHLTTGPIKNRNFPYVALMRAIDFHCLVAQRSHAQRGDLNLTMQENRSDQIPLTQRRSMEKIFNEIRKSSLQSDGEQLSELEAWVLKAIIKDPA